MANTILNFHFDYLNTSLRDAPFWNGSLTETTLKALLGRRTNSCANAKNVTMVTWTTIVGLPGNSLKPSLPPSSGISTFNLGGESTNILKCDSQNFCTLHVTDIFISGQDRTGKTDISRWLLTGSFRNSCDVSFKSHHFQLSKCTWIYSASDVCPLHWLADPPNSVIFNEIPVREARL